MPLAVGVFQLIRHSSPGDHAGTCHSWSPLAAVPGATTVAAGWLGREGSSVRRRAARSIVILKWLRKLPPSSPSTPAICPDPSRIPTSMPSTVASPTAIDPTLTKGTAYRWPPTTMPLIFGAFAGTSIDARRANAGSSTVSVAPVSRRRVAVTPFRTTETRLNVPASLIGTVADLAGATSWPAENDWMSSWRLTVSWAQI